jgi:transcriptional regulator with XRE-family HTH domain
MNSSNTKLPTLGDKIMHFRKKAGFSQFELEIEIDASPGSLSRIEHGSTNPSKETLNKIAEALNLNFREVDYLNGPLSKLPSESEINDAVDSIHQYLNNDNVIAYILDGRARIVYCTQGIIDLLGINKSAMQNSFGKSIVAFVLDPNVNVTSNFDPSYSEEMLTNMLTRYYVKCGFMVGDPSYEETISLINNNDFTKLIWDRIVQNPPHTVPELDRRKIYLLKNGKSQVLAYSIEPLEYNKQFELVEYIPIDK